MHKSAIVAFIISRIVIGIDKRYKVIWTNKKREREREKKECDVSRIIDLRHFTQGLVKHKQFALSLVSCVRIVSGSCRNFRLAPPSLQYSRMGWSLYTHVTTMSFYRTFHLSTLQSSTFILLSLHRWKYRPRAKWAPLLVYSYSMGASKNNPSVNSKPISKRFSQYHIHLSKLSMLPSNWQFFIQISKIKTKTFLWIDYLLFFL